MAGVIENMSPAARERRLGELAHALIDLVREHGELSLRVALRAAAARRRTGISQVKHAADYAMARDLLHLDVDDMLTVP